MFFAPVIRHSAYVPAVRPVDRGFERFVNEALQPARVRGVEVKQDADRWTLQLDLPGVARDQLSIGIEGNTVRIATAEGAARSFKAAYELPQEIDAAASSAKLENGVLSLVLGKKAPESNVTQLTIG